MQLCRYWRFGSSEQNPEQQAKLYLLWEVSKILWSNEEDWGKLKRWSTVHYSNSAATAFRFLNKLWSRGTILSSWRTLYCLLHKKYRAAQVTNTGNSKIKRSKSETKQTEKNNVVIIHLTDVANVLKML